MVGDASVDGSRLSLQRRRHRDLVRGARGQHGRRARRLCAARSPASPPPPRSRTARRPRPSRTPPRAPTTRCWPCCRISTRRSAPRMPTPATSARTSPCTARCTCAQGANCRGPRRRCEPSGALALDGVDDADARGDPRAARAGRRGCPTSCPTTPTSAARRCTGSRTCCRSPRSSATTTPPRPLRTRLVDALTDWTTADRCETESTRCFVYDPEAKGLVGKVASFGSDEFNDHHFHYGYLLYAAAIAVQDDPSLQKRLQPGHGSGRRRPGDRRRQLVLPRSARLRRVRRSLLGLGVRPVPRRQQPGVQLRGGHRLERPRPVGGCRPTTLPLADEARWMLANEAATAQAYWVGFDQEQSGVRRLRPLDRRAQLGQQARLLDVVQRRAGRQARHPADPDVARLGLPRRRCRAHHREPRRGRGAGLRRAVRRLHAHVRRAAGSGCRRRCVRAGPGAARPCRSTTRTRARYLLAFLASEAAR